MDIKFSEEQRMIRDSVRQFLFKNCPSSFVREMVEDEKGFSEDLWKGMAELGWMGLIVPEKYGGDGLGFLDLIVLLEEMGRVLLPGPFFSTVVLGGFTLLEAGNEEQKNRFLPPLGRGERIMTLALNEAESFYDPSSIAVSATERKNTFIIKGTKLFVPDAHVADWIICAARTGTSSGVEEGISLIIVDRRTPGISLRPLRTIAGDKQFEVVFDMVEAPKKNLLGSLNQGWLPLKKVLQRAAVAECAQMVGSGQQVMDLTVAYAKKREQFGRLIGSFQAIQHHCANMLVDLQCSRWVTYKAAWMFDQGLHFETEASIAKAWCNEAHRRIVALGHQVFGGVGYMEEYDLPHYFRRARVAEATFGDSDYHRRIIADHVFAQGVF
ncbi:MAG: acyl-CoA dehydrogenase [Desulfobacteraceae bacterium]|nr:MAG: acyl-CoA dehydrogenase [Desulfobacteraceae bacterium]